MKDSENNYIKTNKIPGYNELVESMETVAQEATSQEILTAVQGIDTSDLAKQGSNPNTSLTGIDEKIDDFYETFDADIALQLQGIIGDTEESVSGTSQTSAQVEELRTLQESYDELADNMQSLADSWAAMVTNRGSLDGWVFQEGTDIQSVYDIFANLSSLVSVEDNLTTLYKGGTGILGGRPFLKSIRFNEVVTITGASSEWRQNNVLELIDFPKMKTFGTVNWCIAQNPELRKVNFPSMYKYTYAGNPGPFYQCYKLIDVVVGPISENFVMFNGWDPTTALDSTSSSLVEAGEPFANNREKLLYNIREHIANRLADVTGIGRTIYFSSNIKAAIQAETGQTTANAFTNKGWTIA